MPTGVKEVTRPDKRVKMIWHDHEFIKDDIVPDFCRPEPLFLNNHPDIRQRHAVRAQLAKEWLAMRGADGNEMPAPMRIIESIQPWAPSIPG